MRRKTLRHTIAKKRWGVRIGLAAATLATLIIGGKTLLVPTYTAIRAFDGDTFETVEHQYIRLSGLDAPEQGLCGSTEAKRELEKYILKTPLYLKVLYHQGARSNALVFNREGSVNEQMIKSGWAVYYNSDSVRDDRFIQASQYARTHKLGVYGHCVQKENTESTGCTIKGNIRGAFKTYHTENCKSYKDTDVELYKGDTWFCTEQEAKDAGFTRAAQCF